MDIEILLRQFCDYSLSIRGYSKETVRRYKYVINSYCRMAGVEKISEVTDDNVRSMFYVGRTEKKWSGNTFIVYHKTLLVFFRWCVKQSYMAKNPIIDIEVPKLEKRLPTKLTKQTALRILEIVYNYPYEYKFLRYRNHAIFSTFIFTGLRKQELLNLKYADVDLDNLTIFVKQGKGNKDRIVPRQDVLKKCDNRCQLCPSRNNLEVHHINSLYSIYSSYDLSSKEKILRCKELWDIDNGAVLCKECHDQMESSKYRADLIAKNS